MTKNPTETRKSTYNSSRSVGSEGELMVGLIILVEKICKNSEYSSSLNRKWAETASRDELIRHTELIKSQNKRTTEDEEDLPLAFLPMS